MLVKDILDFRRIDILAAAQYHVLGAIDDGDETFGVEPREIAGANPPIDKGFRGGVGLVPIAFHDHRSARPQIGRAQSELQSLMRISYAVFCLKKKKQNKINTN